VYSFCTYVVKKLPKENNRSMGEHSPNLVTLIVSHHFVKALQLYKNDLTDLFRFLQ
jgi:hypothetical protein